MSEQKDSDYSRLKLLGKDFECTVCQSQLFIPKRIQVVFDEANDFNFGRKKEFANTLVCKDCGYVHWFLPALAHEIIIKNKSNEKK